MLDGRLGRADALYVIRIGHHLGLHRFYSIVLFGFGRVHFERQHIVNLLDRIRARAVAARRRQLRGPAPRRQIWLRRVLIRALVELVCGLSGDGLDAGDVGCLARENLKILHVIVCIERRLAG